MKSLASLSTIFLLSIAVLCQAKKNEISVRVADGSSVFADGLTAADFVLTVNGIRRNVVALKRESRPLSIVIAVIANPFDRCLTYEGIERYELNEAFSGLLTKGNRIAIVVSDRDGTVVRKFSDPVEDFYSDFVKAFRIADANKTPLTDEYGIQTAEPGSVYPLSALKTGTALIEASPESHDKMILFLRSLRETVTGGSADAREIFGTIIREQISVSWLNNASSEKTYALKKIPYGKRDFFLGLSSITGGYFEPCDEKASLFNVISGRGEAHDVNSNFGKLVEFTRDRYRLTYSYDDVSSKPLLVEVNIKRFSSNEYRLNYGKATLHD